MNVILAAARRLTPAGVVAALVGSVVISIANAQTPVAPAPPPAESVDPAVNTSSAAPLPPPPARPVGQSAARPTPGSTGGRRAIDRVDLDASQITGNRELPRVLYIVPWKRSDLGDLTGRPVNSLLDEVLAPVDRDVFRRETRYFDALAAGPAPASARGDAAAAPTGPAAPTIPVAPSGSGDSVRNASQPVAPPGT